MNTDFQKVKDALVEIAHLTACSTLLDWDEQVNAPIKSNTLRAETAALLAGLTHRKVTNESLFSKVTTLQSLSGLSPEETVIIREVHKDLTRSRKLPTKLIEDLARTTTEAQARWQEAREKNDFKLFLPYLEKIITLKQEEAKLLGFQESPYDALLDEYEPGLTAKKAETIFSALKPALIKLLKNIQDSSKPTSPEALNGTFPALQQQELCHKISTHLGFDYSGGRLDVSSHPFCTTIYPTDVRITTRYHETNLLHALFGTIHETGHGLYEQGLPEHYFGTPLTEAVSLGIHESQSRIWENMVGRSQAFWHYFYPLLCDTFPKPFKDLPLDEFYRRINHVAPSLIRTEADEVTYNLHILLRFELEKDLLEGTLSPKNLPEAWNQKVQEYLGISVPSDREGVLQDIHWSGGNIGYFPTYTLGNVYAAQLYAAAKKDLKGLEENFRLGNFTPFLQWLRENIHQHGRTYSPEELLQRATGEEINPQHFLYYLTAKYKKVYDL